MRAAEGQGVVLALHPAYATGIVWKLLEAKAKLVHICLQKAVCTYPQTGLLEI